MTNFYEVTSPAHFQELLSQDLSRVSLINFWASWAAPCTQMNEITLELSKKYPNLLVLQVEADAQADIAESFDIEAVPSFLVLRGHTLLGRISGADAPALTDLVKTHTSSSSSSVQPKSQTTQSPASAPSTAPPTSSTPEDTEKHLRSLMTQSKVVLFMKGNPDEPRCGFSRKTVALLREQGIKFTTFDILSDESVRSGLKVLNDWPTFPQIIVDGELVGGLDILTEAVESGEFMEMMGQ